MSAALKTISPVDGRIYVERPLASEGSIDAAIARSRAAQPAWRAIPLAERIGLLSRAVDAFVARKSEIAEELTWQMGRPIRYSRGELVDIGRFRRNEPVRAGRASANQRPTFVLCVLSAHLWGNVA